MGSCRRPVVAVFAFGLVLLAGCGEDQSALDPQGPPARRIAALWWWMMGVAWVVLLGAVAMLGVAWLRRRKAGLPVLGEDERASNALVVAFGMVIPAIALVALFIVANFSVASGTQAPRRGTTALTVEVIGHQWWWEVRYPGTPAVTANEIHIPAGTSVDVLARPADVIHSFWVPELNRKIDMIPGRTNRVELEADHPGIYRGQCAELCGLQHAHMAMWVVAQPRRAFEAWLRAMSGPRRTPATALARRGERVFLTQGCADCHAVRGTAARGRIGPDLTHLRSRETLAAVTIPNDPADLAAWIRDPQHVKPGNRMPDLGIRGADLRAVVGYLEALR
jgi:cytochrome c oxidase subunit 2